MTFVSGQDIIIGAKFFWDRFAMESPLFYFALCDTLKIPGVMTTLENEMNQAFLLSDDVKQEILVEFDFIRVLEAAEYFVEKLSDYPNILFMLTEAAFEKAFNEWLLEKISTRSDKISGFFRNITGVQRHLEKQTKMGPFENRRAQIEQLKKENFLSVLKLIQAGFLPTTHSPAFSVSVCKALFESPY